MRAPGDHKTAHGLLGFLVVGVAATLTHLWVGLACSMC